MNKKIFEIAALVAIFSLSCAIVTGTAFLILITFKKAMRIKRILRVSIAISLIAFQSFQLHRKLKRLLYKILN